MKRVVMIVCGAVLLMGARSCSKCEKATAEAAAICAAQGEESQACVDARAAAEKACEPEPVPTPTPTPPAPGPVCEAGQVCSCWNNPTGTEWVEAKCPTGQECTPEKTCRTPEPVCPTCPEGQVCLDPKVGCVSKPVESCPAPQPPLVREDNGEPHWRMNCKAHTQQMADCTPVEERAWDYCKAIGMGWMDDEQTIPRGTCPVRPDGHPERVACETYLMGGEPALEGRNGASCEFNPDNRMQFYLSGGNCRLCNAARTVCGAWL